MGSSRYTYDLFYFEAIKDEAFFEIIYPLNFRTDIFSLFDNNKRFQSESCRQPDREQHGQLHCREHVRNLDPLCYSRLTTGKNYHGNLEIKI